MNTLLSQALIFTLVGMGMTFAAIGLLVMGMYAMTALIRDAHGGTRKAVVVTVEQNRQAEATAKQISEVVFPGVTIAPDERKAQAMEHQDGGGRTSDDRYRAAAIAVAVALAVESASTAAQQANVALADSWSAFVRGQSLAQRQRYYARRM